MSHIIFYHRIVICAGSAMVSLLEVSNAGSFGQVVKMENR